MQITMNNHNNIIYESMFDDLIQEVFGFSFKPWFQYKLWNERYESYSFIENGRMLANICIFKLEMVLNEEIIPVYQLGAVATRKEKRGKGLARSLMEHVLTKYLDTPMFLAANPGVLKFYPRFGFRRIQVYRPEVMVDINNNSSRSVKLLADDERVMNSLWKRGAYSSIMDSLGTQSVQMFHLLLDFPDRIYLLPNCEAIVIAEQEGDRLFIADVVTSKPMTFDEIWPELPFTGIRRVTFGFCPDWLNITPEWVPIDMNESPYFIRGEWNLPEKYRFPVLSET